MFEYFSSPATLNYGIPLIVWSLSTISDKQWPDKFPNLRKTLLDNQTLFQVNQIHKYCVFKKIVKWNQKVIHQE